jgi:lysozyme
MTVRDVLTDLMRDEGFRSRIYVCTAGKPSVGYGRNLQDRGVTEEEAQYLLNNDVLLAEKELTAWYPWWVKCPGSVRRGLINMAVNLGISRLDGFRKMLACLQAGDYKGAAREALNSKWSDQVGERAVRIAKLFEEATGD